MKNKFRTWLANLSIAAISTAITLVLLNYVFLAVAHFVHHDSMYVFDPLLGWRVAPNLNRARTPYLTYTDVHGFRILPQEARDTRAYDVMLLGDSFCYGSWLPAEQTLVGLLKLNHPALRIANASVPGYGTDQELLTLARYAPMLKPGGTVIVLTYVNDFNDIRDHWDEIRQKPWFEMSGGKIVLRRPDSRVNSIFWSARILYLIPYLGWLAAGAPQPVLYGDDAYAARLYAALLERMAGITAARGGRLVVLYTSGREAESSAGQRWSRAAREGAASAGAEFILVDDSECGTRDGMFLPGDIHWTAAGNLCHYRDLAPRLEAFLAPQSSPPKKNSIASPERSEPLRNTAQRLQSRRFPAPDRPADF